MKTANQALYKILPPVYFMASFSRLERCVMRYCGVWLLVLCFAASGCTRPKTVEAPAPAPAVDPARVQVLQERVVTMLDKFDLRLAGPNADPTSRDLPYAALAKLILGRNPANAEKLLRRLFGLQDMNPESPDYGSFPWQENHPEINDKNADQFCLLPVGAIFTRFSGQFSQKFLSEAEPHLRAGVIALQRRKVGPPYTNIFLMKMGSLVLLGQALKDQAVMREGEEMLDQWMAFTRSSGVIEYDSSTYAAVTMGVLQSVYNFTNQASVKQKLKACMDFLWADLAANYFEGNQTLSGPQSRYYNFLVGDENVKQLYYLAGLRTMEPGSTLLSDDVRIWSNAAVTDYRPPAFALALASLPERLIKQRFGSEAGKDRTNFVAEDFAIGSVSAFYGNQDNQISVSLKSAKTLPFIQFTADSTDSPYGKIKSIDRSGHKKPRKEKDLIASVQARDAVLAVASVMPPPGGNVTCLASNIILPLLADGIYVDDRRVDTSLSVDTALTERSTIFVREGSAAIAIRLFAADALAGQNPVLSLKFDGREWGAGRVVAYHYRGKEANLEGQEGQVGFFVIARRCATEESFAAFRDEVMAIPVEIKNDRGIWEASMVWAGHSLKAGIDLQEHRIASRLIDGTSQAVETLTVNGRDYAGEILGPFVDRAGAPGSRVSVDLAK